MVIPTNAGSKIKKVTNVVQPQYTPTPPKIGKPEKSIATIANLTKSTNLSLGIAKAIGKA